MEYDKQPAKKPPEREYEVHECVRHASYLVTKVPFRCGPPGTGLLIYNSMN